MEDFKYKTKELFKDKNINVFVAYPPLSYPSTNEIREFYRKVAIIPEQTHSSNIKVVKDSCDQYQDTDALISFIPGTTLGIVTADCVPILLYASDIEGIAAVHAGWRGTLDGILEKVMASLIEKGADPQNIKAFFGPSISVGRYETDEELAAKFTEKGFGQFVKRNDPGFSKPHIDLQGINREYLLRHGVKKGNIYLSDECTFSSKDSNGNYLYPSHRRDKTLLRNLNAITLL